MSDGTKKSKSESTEEVENTELESEVEDTELESEVEDIELEKDDSTSVDEQGSEMLNIQEENDKLRSKYTRLLADYDNLKRRSSLEVLSAKNSGKEEVFSELLEIIDNFERALMYEPSTVEFKDGINLVHKTLIDRLENLGLEEVTTTGQLDPSFHQAVTVETVDELEDNEIIEVLQKGYVIEDKLLRPAMVKVNKK